MWTLYFTYGIITILLIHAMLFGINKIIASKKKYSMLKSQANNYHLFFQVFAIWLNNLHNKKNIAEYLLEQGHKNVAVYGGDTICGLVCSELENTAIEVKYLIDQNAYKSKEVTGYKGLDIVCVDEIQQQEKVDAIIVTSINEYNLINKKIRQVAPDIPTISLDQIVFSL